MAGRGWRTKRGRKALAAVVYAVLGRGLVASARLDERVREEVRSWPDGTVVTTTYGHWTPGEEPYIVAVRIRPEDLPTA